MPTEETASQEVTSQEQKKPSPDVPITETPEFQRAVQSEADKRVKVFEQKLGDLQAESRIEIRKLQEEFETERKSLRERIEAEETSAFINKYVEDGSLSETSAPPIRDFALKLYQRDKESREGAAKVTERERQVEVKEKEVADLKMARDTQKKAAELGITLSLSEAEAIGKESEGNAKFMEHLIKAKVVTTVPPEPSKPKRPGAPGTTPSGTGDEAAIRKRYRDNPDDPKAKEDYLRWRREKGI